MVGRVHLVLEVGNLLSKVRQVGCFDYPPTYHYTSLPTYLHIYKPIFLPHQLRRAWHPCLPGTTPRSMTNIPRLSHARLKVPSCYLLPRPISLRSYCNGKGNHSSMREANLDITPPRLGGCNNLSSDQSLEGALRLLTPVLSLSKIIYPVGSA